MDRVKLGQLAELITKGSTPTTSGHDYTNSGIPFLRVENITESGFLDLSQTKYISEETHQFLSRSRLSPGDLLFSIAGALGRVCIVPEDLPRANTNQAIALIRLSGDTKAEIHALYLKFALQGESVKAQVRISAAQLAQANLSLKQVGELKLLIPRLGEQRKIAAILVSIDDAIQTTQAVIDQLGVVKKALMAELLTHGIPGRHAKFKRTEIGEVPEGWVITPLSDVAFVQTGIAKGKPFDNGIEVPYLRVANVQDGYVDLSEVKTIAVDQQAVARYALQPGDVLFTEGGDADKLGRGCVWRGEIGLCLHQNHVFAVRTEARRLLPDYLAHWAASPRGKSYFLDCAKQTTNLASINSTQLRAFPVAIPPVSEQAEIVAAIGSVETRFAVERESHETAISLKTALMSALLTGELRVPPDKDPP